MPTIKDVAKQVGVSTATVSHVINKTRFLSDEVRKRVLGAIEELDYHPNAVARSLVKKRTHTIGIIISDILNPFYTAIVRGIEDVTYQRNTVIIGDAAGQSKPTTAGGIYSCGVGGVLAGKAISSYLESKNMEDLKSYQKSWNQKFGKEFEKQVFARKMLERLDNPTIDKIFSAITPEMISDISKMTILIFTQPQL